MTEPKQSSLSDFSDIGGSKKGVKGGSKKRPINTSPQAEAVLLNTSERTSPHDPIQWHRTHRCLYVFDFEGVQPTRGAEKVSRVGPTQSIPQAKYPYPEGKALIFTLPGTLKIWIKHPKGTKTVEQIVGAHETARRLAQEFARKHGIAVLGERESRFSEHTIESKPLDRLIRPIVAEEPEFAKEKLGLSVNQTSHKGKVEWTGRKAKDRVMGLEWILDGGINREFESVKETLTTMSGTLKELMEYSKKPPELGNSKDYR